MPILKAACLCELCVELVTLGEICKKLILENFQEAPSVCWPPGLRLGGTLEAQLGLEEE